MKIWSEREREKREKLPLNFAIDIRKTIAMRVKAIASSTEN